DFFFFQAEDGIRDGHVTGVQTCALPISTFHALRIARAHTGRDGVVLMQGGYNGWHNDVAHNVMTPLAVVGPRVSPGEYPLAPLRSEERRVGKEWRYRWARGYYRDRHKYE